MNRTEEIPVKVNRMLCQLVSRREGISVRVIRVLSQRVNESYRMYICKSNKDAESASWIRSGRAAKRKI